MYLKTLTLRGFKSFASTTTLTFEPGITALVGPNGSGKSNIVDALSWVMGEQGVKPLRGGKMEDVIFAGTSARAPLGRAEVQLTIDNTDHSLPIDYSEVTISRTMFRSGGSEYAINGTTCRLLDVQELLSDTGMGREMHVIVGQGQLDAILGATPEQRRGFIEEAAGVLKHRRRKERAQHKLEATKANLARLSDLVAEIRRQLKPLGRQAEVARRAAAVQADVRDARARLLADDLTQAMAALEAEAMAEAEQEKARQSAEMALTKAREDEAAAEAVAAEALPRLSAAQELWYSLTALRERVASTLSIAVERVSHAADASETPAGLRDPETLEAEAASMRVSEEALRGEIEQASAILQQAEAKRASAEQAASDAESAYSLALRTASDRREGLAKLGGQVGALRSRIEAGLATDARMRSSLADAEARTLEAMGDYQAMESRLASLDDAQLGLDAAFDDADATWQSAAQAIEAARQHEADAGQKVASLKARIEALELSLGADVSAQLTDSGAVSGIAGRLAASIVIEPGWEMAVAAALGPLAESVVADSLTAARDAVDWLKKSNTGRAALLVRGVGGIKAPPPPAGSRWVADAVRTDDGLSGAVRLALRGIVAVDDLPGAIRLAQAEPDLMAVTRDGDVISRWQVRGGAAGDSSQLQVQAALDKTKSDLEGASHQAEKVRFEMARATAEEASAKSVREEALANLNQSDAAIAALTEQLNVAKQKAASAKAEAGRLQVGIDEARSGREKDQASLAGLEQRLEAASTEGGNEEPDPSAKDAATEALGQVREQEMEARLALRTVEERATALAGRADALMAAAEQERARRAAAIERAERLRREAEKAQAVRIGAEWLATQVDAAIDAAGIKKSQADEARLAAQAGLAQARAAARERSVAFENVVAGAHRGELDRIEQRLRLEQLSERSLAELGLEAAILIDEYGPDVPVPVPAEGDEPGVTKPYDRTEQATRLRRAEQDLAVLGKVNPLALEEFDAMSERHAFLAEQMEDVKRTHADLVGIIDEVDTQVQQVFAAAFADVAKTFSEVFSRLFPGGEGQLFMTDPNDLLATGVDVEARPAGKKVKRLSLLSGGERALVAVAFMLALFIARPSPFYILDEVEAALDDTNLSRLLDIYEELRQSSQLLIITHQKRTMEVADALYGVTMRGDGVSRVVSQKLVDR